MGIFRAIIGVAIETAKLPIALLQDAATLGNVGQDKPFTIKKLEDIRREAEKADD